MPHAILYDCEFLTAEGAMSRNWYGPQDPDPVIAQIGAAKLSLTTGRVTDTLRLHVLPRGRRGERVPLDPVFIALTGITEAMLDAEGVPLDVALARLDAFSEGARLWAWGKDELNMMAISCWVAGIVPPMGPARFGHAGALALKAGMPLADCLRTRSNGLAAYYGVETPGLRAHDGLDDALSVAQAMGHLLTTRRLTPADFA